MIDFDRMKLLATELLSLLSSGASSESEFDTWRFRMRDTAQSLYDDFVQVPGLIRQRTPQDAPIPMLLWCPECNLRHVDKGKFATKPHHTHACQHCGAVWRPAVLHTVGVQFLPGFKDEEP